MEGSQWQQVLLGVVLLCCSLLEMKPHHFLQWKVSEEVLGQFETATASANGIWQIAAAFKTPQGSSWWNMFTVAPMPYAVLCVQAAHQTRKGILGLGPYKKQSHLNPACELFSAEAVALLKQRWFGWEVFSHTAVSLAFPPGIAKQASSTKTAKVWTHFCHFWWSEVTKGDLGACCAELCSYSHPCGSLFSINTDQSCTRAAGFASLWFFLLCSFSSSPLVPVEVRQCFT